MLQAAQNQMLQELREVAAAPYSKGLALHCANMATRVLIELQNSSEEQRRVLLGLARSGSAAEASVGNPNYREWFLESLEAAIKMLAR